MAKEEDIVYVPRNVLDNGTQYYKGRIVEEAVEFFERRNNSEEFEPFMAKHTNSLGSTEYSHGIKKRKILTVDDRDEMEPEDY